mgnify:CR=1 FL=1
MLREPNRRVSRRLLRRGSRRLLGFLLGGLFLLLKFARPIGGMDRLMVCVGLGQPRLVEYQRVEALEARQFVIVIHLDRIERAVFRTKSAIHANINIDIKLRRIRNRATRIWIT